MTDRVQHIQKILDIHSVDAITDVLSTIKTTSDYTETEKLEITKSLCDVFYHAHHTGSTIMPKLALNIAKQIAKFGPELLPFLLKETLEADSESAKYFGQAIAKNKQEGLYYILPKLEEYEGNEHEIINLVQVFGYFKIPEVIDAIPPLLKCLDCKNFQVTSMTLYTLGRLVQKHKKLEFTETIKDHMFQSLFRCLSHPKDLVRKNSARALGKMLRKGLLTNGYAKEVFLAFQAITGKDHQHNWDRAYIVRREVEDYLPYFRRHVSDENRYDQSFEILTKRELCDKTFHFTVEAPFVARKILPGQFIIIRPHEKSERIPFSVCGWNRKQGTLEIIVAGVGKTTNEIISMEPGAKFLDLVGPLGNPTPKPEYNGTCVLIGGGYGIGAILPTARELSLLGNKVIGIAGARNSDSLIMVSELVEACDEVIVTTDDGTRGIKGLVTDALRSIMDQEAINYVLAIGPVPMMRAVSEHTKESDIPTFVSLNAIMVDGTGMCGACRVSVGGESKFACFHGPDFNGHLVDFENLIKRQKMFVKEEKMALAN